MGRILGLIRYGKQSKIIGQRKVKTWKNCPHISDLIHLQSMQLGLSVSLSLSLPVLSLHASSLLKTLYLSHYSFVCLSNSFFKANKSQDSTKNQIQSLIGELRSCFKLPQPWPLYNHWRSKRLSYSHCIFLPFLLQMNLFAWVYFWALYCVPFICVSLSLFFFLPVSYCFHYYSFVVQSEVWELDASSFINFSQDCFGQSGYFCDSMQILGLCVLVL